jgi:hypothetical protein
MHWDLQCNTLVAASLFAMIFIFGWRLHLKTWRRGRANGPNPIAADASGRAHS